MQGLHITHIKLLPLQISKMGLKKLTLDSGAYPLHVLTKLRKQCEVIEK